MANPNNITLRSEKGSFLTFEEMDLNLTELQNQIIEYNKFLIDQFNPLDQDHDDLRIEWSDFQTLISDQVSVIETDITDIQNDQQVQNNKISQNESDILALQLGGGLTYQGTYNDLNEYTIGDVVTYTDGLDHISVANNNTEEPVSGEKTNSWIVLTTMGIAKFVVYDNASSGMTSTNIQDAIDELKNSSISDFGDPEWTLISTNTTLNVTAWYEVDFTSGPLTFTLPTNPSRDDSIKIYNSIGDSTGSILDRNGNTIMGISENLTIDYNITSLNLVFNGSDWRVL